MLVWGVVSCTGVFFCVSCLVVFCCGLQGYERGVGLGARFVVSEVIFFLRVGFKVVGLVGRMVMICREVESRESRSVECDKLLAYFLIVIMDSKLWGFFGGRSQVKLFCF